MKQLFGFLLISLLCGTITATKTHSDDSDLVLSENSKLETRGCYHYNRSLSLCFDIQPGSIKLETQDGRTLVFDQLLGQDESLLQILGARFLSRGSRMLFVPADAPTSPTALSAYLRHHFGSEYQPTEADLQSMQLNYQNALEALGKTPEFLLVGFVVAAFNDHPPVQDISQFREMIGGLLKLMPGDLPVEFQPADQRQYYGRQKRCADLTKGSDPQCRGMCGKGCSCWWIVCFNCCYNQGCWEHDECCAADWNSDYCQKPWRHGWSCSSYGGYPACLSRG